jgi:hypothetical protein
MKLTLQLQTLSGKVEVFEVTGEPSNVPSIVEHKGKFFTYGKMNGPTGFIFNQSSQPWHLTDSEKVKENVAS